MTARQMFENLGYGYRELDDDVFQYSRASSIVIRFYKKEREFCSVEFFGPKNINMDEFKAIHQQLKELGWLEEETCTNKTYKKLTYKLTKFEIDLLQSCSQGYSPKYQFKNINSLTEMRKNGYFKCVNRDETIEEILANCEVVG